MAESDLPQTSVEPTAPPERGVGMSMPPPRQPLTLTAPSRLDTTLGVDRAYADAAEETRYQAALDDPEINPPKPAPKPAPAPVPTPAAPADALGVPPEAGRQTSTQLLTRQKEMAGPPDKAKPAPVYPAINAALAAAAHAGHAILGGVSRLAVPRPMGGGNVAEEAALAVRDKALAVREILLEGLMGVFSVPLSFVSAGALQAIENDYPETLDTTQVLPDGGFLRMMLGMGFHLTPQEMRAPMMLREALDILIQSAPLALGARGAAHKVRAGGQLALEEAGRRAMAPDLPGQGATTLGMFRIRGEITPTLTARSETMNDLRYTAAGLYHSGLRDRATFDAAMVNEVGEAVRPHLATLFADAPAQVKDVAATTTGGRLPSTTELFKKYKLGEFGKDWYKHARAFLREHFGEAGELMGDLIAATSANTQLDSNITKALQLMERRAAGESVQAIYDSMVGPNGPDLHRENVRNAFLRHPIEGPKVGEFAKAIGGMVEAIVQDVWNQRVFRFTGDTPTESQRAFVAALMTQEARRLGIEPRQYQAALWIAEKILAETKKYGGGEAGRATATALAGRSLEDVVREKIAERTGRAQAAELHARLAEPDGGFTVHMVTGEQPTTGKMVAIYPARGRSVPGGRISQKQIAKFVEDNRDLLGQKDHYFGGWHDPTDGKVWLDVSVRRGTAAEAQALAEQHGEKAYYDLDAGRSVRVEKGAANAKGESGVREGDVVDDGRGDRENLRGADGQDVGPDRRGARGDRGDSEGEAAREAFNTALDNLPDLGPTTEAGRAQLGPLIATARIVAGALAGAETGDDFESRLKGALAGAGLGALASKATLTRLRALAGEAKQAFGAQRATLLGQRGSVGAPGEPTPPTGEPAAGARETGALNLERVTAPTAVKAVMQRLHDMAGAGERLREHRKLVSHEATIAASQALGANVEKLMNTRLEDYVPTAAESTAMRDLFTAVSHVSTDLEARMLAGDRTAQAEYIHTQAMGVVLGAVREAGLRNAARTLEAAKIYSEAERADVNRLAVIARQLGVETGMHPEADVGRAFAAKAEAAGKRGAEPERLAIVPQEAAGGLMVQSGETRLFYTVQGDTLNVVDVGHAGTPSLRDFRAVLQAVTDQAQQAGATKITADLVNPKLIGLLRRAEIPFTERGKFVSIDVGALAERVAPKRGGITAGEALAEKLTAELKAQQPHLSPEALLATTKAIQRALLEQEAGEARAFDQVAVTVANALMASGQTQAPTVMTLMEAVARKMTMDLLALPQAETVHPAALLGAMRSYLQSERAKDVHYNTWWAGMKAGASIAYAAWVQGLLSGLKSLSRNLTGMAVSMPLELPKRFVAEWVNAVLKDPDGYQRGETAHALSQSWEAVGSAFRLMAEAWRENKSPWEEELRKRSKVSVLVLDPRQREARARDISSGKAARRDNSAEAHNLDPESTWGGVIDTLNNALNSRYTPGGLLITSDAFAQGLSFSLNISALAYREAVREGLKPGTPEFVRRVTELERAPLEHMIIEAQDQAVEVTLNREFGPTGQMAVELINRIPGGRLQMPFIRWGGNAAKWTVQHTAILNLMSSKNLHDIWGNDFGAPHAPWSAAGPKARARDEAISRVIVGTAATGLIAYAVAQGYITPSKMLTPVQRFFRPFREEGSDDALKIGNVYVSGYSQWGGQAGQMAALIANYVDLMRHIPDQESYNQLMSHFQAVSIAAGYTFVKQSSMQTLGNWWDAFQDPNRDTGKVLKGMARSGVPTLLRDVTKSFVDPVIPELNGMWDAFRSGLPFFREGIPAHRNRVTGEALLYPAALAPDFLWPFGAFVNLVVPITFTAQKDRPWAREVEKNAVMLRELGDYVSMHGFTTTAPADLHPQLTSRAETGTVKLSAAQKDNAKVYMTQTAKDRNGHTLAQALDALVASELYQQRLSPGTQGGQAAAMRETYNEFMQRSHYWLLNKPEEGGSPTLLPKVLEAQRQKDNLKRMQDDPQSPHFTPPGGGPSAAPSGGMSFNPLRLFESLGR